MVFNVFVMWSLSVLPCCQYPMFTSSHSIPANFNNTTEVSFGPLLKCQTTRLVVGSQFGSFPFR